MADRISFDGQAAIVTGAGGGMGRAYALELARRGAAVLVNDYGGDVLGDAAGAGPAAERVAAEIVAGGGRAKADTNAVGDAAGARAIAGAALAAFGRIDILVNNAGIVLPGGFTATPDEAVERLYRTNLIGAHHLMRAVWPHMVDARHGRILNVSSNAALGVGGNAPYGAAKAGLIGLTLDSAIEGRPFDICVNAVMPTAYSRMIEQIPDRATVAWFERNMPPEKVARAMTWFLNRECSESGRILLAGGGRIANLLFAEAGELFDPDLDAEDVARGRTDLFAETGLSITHSQAEAGERYMRFFPWQESARPDFAPDLSQPN